MRSNLDKITNLTFSEDVRTLITAIFFVFFLPVGLLLMWIWTNWSKKVKEAVTAVAILIIFLVFLGIANFPGIHWISF